MFRPPYLFCPGSTQAGAWQTAIISARISQACVCVCMLSRVRVLSHVCVLISVSRSTLLRIFCQDYRLVPQTAWTHLGVLTVIIKQLCLDLCAARACPAISLLFTVHSCLSKSLVCISTAQAREIWGPAAGACRDCALVVTPYACSHMAVTFRGRRKRNLVFWMGGTLVKYSRLYREFTEYFLWNIFTGIFMAGGM